MTMKSSCKNNQVISDPIRRFLLASQSKPRLSESIMNPSLDKISNS